MRTLLDDKGLMQRAPTVHEVRSRQGRADSRRGRDARQRPALASRRLVLAAQRELNEFNTGIPEARPCHSDVSSTSSVPDAMAVQGAGGLVDLLAVSMSAFHWTLLRARGYDLGISQKKSRLARTLARHASLTQCPITA